MTKETRYLLLIIIIFIGACIETDIYLPAFPDMMEFFSVSEEVIQSLLTWNFFGICISGPLYGPLSDAFGRRKPLLGALGLFLIGSIITLCADTFPLMLYGRLLQGLGCGGCFALGPAIIFDAFHEKEAIIVLSRLNAAIPFFVAVAPMLGGYLNHVYGFRANFLTIAAFVALSFVVCLLFFKETLAKERRISFSLGEILRDFGRVFASLPFWQVTITVSLIFGGYLVFVSTSAVLFVLEMGVTKKQFPFFQAAILLAYLVASFPIAKLIESRGARNVKRWGRILTVGGGLALGVAAWLAPRNPYFLTLPMLFYAFGANWIGAVYFSEAMELMPDIKGITASLLTSARLFFAALLVGAVSVFYDGTVLPLAISIVSSSLVVLVTTYLYEKSPRPT